MEIFGPDFQLRQTDNRIAVAGTTGAGKSTLCAQLAQGLGYPYTELDSLYHGPGWEPRAEFIDEVEALTAENRWVSEWQYRAVRPVIAQRAQVMIWLDLPFRVRFGQLLKRTIKRGFGRTELWNGNREPGIRSWFLPNDNNILWWGWTTRHKLDKLPALLHKLEADDLTLIRLRSRKDLRTFADVNGLHTTAHSTIRGDRV